MLFLLSVSANFANTPDQTISIKNNTDQSLNLNLSIPEYTAAVIAMTKLKSAQEMLRKAILDNSTEGIKEAVLAGADVNFNKNGETPLLLAVILKHSDMVDILLGYGAIANESLVENAIKQIDFKTAILLTKKGKLNINAFYFGSTLLGHALQRYRAEEAHLLVQSGANFSRCFDESKSSLLKNDAMNYAIEIEAINNRSNTALALIQELINHGYNIHDNNYNSCIWKLAIMKRSQKSLNLFIKNGANPNQSIDISKSCRINGAYVTPLFIAITYGNAETVELLLKAGANINQKANTDLYTKSLSGLNSPLAYAISTGRSEIIKVLLAHGATL